MAIFHRSSGRLSRSVILILVLAAVPSVEATAQRADPMPSDARRQIMEDSVDALYWDAYSDYQTGTPELVRRSIDGWLQTVSLLRRLGNARYLETVLRSVASAYETLGVRDSAQIYVAMASRAEALAGIRRHASPLRGLGLTAAGVRGWFPGEVHDPFETGMGADIALRYGVASGLGMGAGITLEGHGVRGRTQSGSPAIGEIRATYNLMTAYVEPRYVWYPRAKIYAPFVAARFGLARESLSGSGARFTASGLTVGGSVGLQLRVHPQLALDAGLRMQRVGFGDFTFSGEALIEQCLQPLRQDGAPFPTAVAHCAGLRDFAQVSECDAAGIITGVGCRDAKVHVGSSRTSSWLGVWIGLNVKLSGS